VSVAWWLGVRRGAPRRAVPHEQRQQNVDRLPTKSFFLWRQKSENSFEHITFYKMINE